MDRHAALKVISEDAKACRRCPRRVPGSAVLTERGGSLEARCLLVAEAPGPQGAAKTGIPLSGDRAGDRFDTLLAEARLQRDALFVTNAVLCAPSDAAKGAGRPTRRSELKACSGYLRRVVELVDPVVVVTLGAPALAATASLESHDLSLRWSAGRPHRWMRRFLLPLYHPGARSASHRTWAEQRADFRALGDLLADSSAPPPI